MADSTPAPAAAAAPLAAPFAKPAEEPVYLQGNFQAEQAYRQAEGMIRAGTDPERVKAALTADGYSPEQLDNRTPEQKAHDREFGIEHRADPAALFFLIPPGTAENVAALSADLRGLAVDIGLSHDSGNQFCNLLVAAVRAGNAEADPAAARDKHRATLAAVFGDKLAEKTADVNWLLDNYAGDVPPKLRDGLKPGGPLGSRPEVFVALANRAWTMRRYSETRPK